MKNKAATFLSSSRADVDNDLSAASCLDVQRIPATRGPASVIRVELAPPSPLTLQNYTRIF
ncbi:hypothetical protein [Candidatus Villigracilis saccharophilus]|uniref:hypothetical protein n=1 Tax=Candidatus Villigracilis saccharophilus TaxID=3140684 RepID=UPI003135709F|nr:hypothetical protein [Anaerolineales bacterium]